MKQYHYNWLEAHPYRNELWLRTMLAEGFEIHHVDHNHDNDDPKNLALIYGPDHSAMYGRSDKTQSRNHKKLSMYTYLELFTVVFAVLYVILKSL